MKILQSDFLVTSGAKSYAARLLRLNDFLYISSCATLSAMLAIPSAYSFGQLSFWFCLLQDSFYLLAAAIVTSIYTSLCGSSSWAKVTSGAVIMFLSSAVVFSLIRQNITLIVFASLFSFPGAIFGAIQPASLLAKRNQRI